MWYPSVDCLDPAGGVAEFEKSIRTVAADLVPGGRSIGQLVNWFGLAWLGLAWLKFLVSTYYYYYHLRQFLEK
jgi:hypothetical protein